MHFDIREYSPPVWVIWIPKNMLTLEQKNTKSCSFWSLASLDIRNVVVIAILG